MVTCTVTLRDGLTTRSTSCRLTLQTAVCAPISSSYAKPRQYVHLQDALYKLRYLVFRYTTRRDLARSPVTAHPAMARRILRWRGPHPAMARPHPEMARPIPRRRGASQYGATHLEVARRIPRLRGPSWDAWCIRRWRGPSSDGGPSQDGRAHDFLRIKKLYSRGSKCEGKRFRWL